MTSADFLMVLIAMGFIAIFIGIIYLIAKGADRLIKKLKEWKEPEVTPNLENVADMENNIRGSKLLLKIISKILTVI